MIKTLKLWADYKSTGIFDADKDLYLFPEDIDISDELWAEVEKWVDTYDFIIPLDLNDRLLHRRSIDMLDIWGKFLAKRLKAEAKNKYTVIYYSEGLMQQMEYE